MDNLQGNPLVSIRKTAITALLLCSAQVNMASELPVATAQHEFDVLVNEVIESLINAEIPLAQKQAVTLTEQYPSSKLAQLLFAETQAVAGFQGSLLGTTDVVDKQLLDLLLEARVRLHAPTPDSVSLPNTVVQAGSQTKHVVLVDVAASVLWLLDTKGPTPIIQSQHYISSGSAGFNKFAEGDLKTPLGVYRINGIRHDESLPALYGAGALMLDYPNDFDQANARGGSGIWLHGVPRGEWNRPPYSSEGCVTMANEHFETLAGTIDPSNTLVLFDSNITWHNPSELREHKVEMLALFRRFQNAWQQPHLSALEALYSDSMQTAAIPQQDNSFIRAGTNSSPMPFSFDAEQIQSLSLLDTRDVSILRHRSLSADLISRELTVMSFELGSSRLQVALYWAKDSRGLWRIIHQSVSPTSV